MATMNNKWLQLSTEVTYYKFEAIFFIWFSESPQKRRSNNTIKANHKTDEVHSFAE